VKSRWIVLCLALLALPVAVHAQPARKTPHIGVLASRSPEAPGPSEGLREGLRELGYVEGQNVTVTWVWARQDERKFPELAAQLVRLNVDVIVAANNAAVEAAHKATRSIPIVMVLVEDPIASGFVTSLARPGGNVTGFSSQWTELFAKRLQLLKDVTPQLSRVAVLWDPTFGTGDWLKKEVTGPAPKALGLRLQLLEVRRTADLEESFAAMTREKTNAVLVQGSTLLMKERARLVELVLKHRLPSMCTLRGYAEAGCLMAYGVDFTDLYRRSAAFVDKIIKGAKPADLPIEQPTKFELVLNAKTAKTLGLTIPPSLRLQATEVLE
jgi:putative tryptophan/tyrosine transport system substrate-binding protein